MQVSKNIQEWNILFMNKIVSLSFVPKENALPNLKNVTCGNI